MSGKPSVDGWCNDRDTEYLDNSIALILDAIENAEMIVETSDDPAIVQAAVNVIKANRAIQARYRDYRPRLVELRRAARAGRD